MHKVLGALLEVDAQELVREELGPFSFDDAKPHLERTLDLFRRLNELDLEGVPAKRLNQLANHAEDALEHFRAIEDFAPKHEQNPKQVQDQLINQLRNKWENYFNTITPVIAYRGHESLDLTSLEREAEGTVSRLKEEMKEFEAEREKAEADMEAALDKVREAAAEAGVAQEAIYFGDEAEKHEKASWVWLSASIVIAVIALLYVFLAVEPKLVELATAETTRTRTLISITVSRLIVISILTFGVVWCASNFSRSRHNYVVNRHRRNALSTFDTFVSAAGDPDTKNMVLIQATRSIFAPQPTGYTGEDQEPQSRNQFVEIMRGMTGGEE